MPTPHRYEDTDDSLFIQLSERTGIAAADIKKLMDALDEMYPGDVVDIARAIVEEEDSDEDSDE